LFRRQTAKNAPFSSESWLSFYYGKTFIHQGILTHEEARNFLQKDDFRLLTFFTQGYGKSGSSHRTRFGKAERICIYGDYDVDGVTATTILYTYLSRKGANCCYYIPERITEGYGLSMPVIERLSGNVDLLITVDTGVTAINEANYAKQLGMDMIITDHHNCREVLPDCVAY
jgi:single-stranded-DNA-specific exonuclease